MLRKLSLVVLLLFSTQVWSLSSFYQNGWISKDSGLEFYVQYPEITESLYLENPSQLLWSDSNASSALEFQLSIIDQAKFSPLFSRQLKRLRYYREQNLWFEYDILATDTLVFYISYSENAPLIGQPWYFTDKLQSKLPNPSLSALSELKQYIVKNQLAILTMSYAPPVVNYDQFTKSYQLLELSSKKQLEEYVQVGVKRRGSRLPNRDHLISRIEMVGIPVRHLSDHVANYDYELEQAVRAFQKMHGLSADGVLGPQTIEWLNMDPESRLNALALNAERARLWPTERDSLILVNVPSFEMKYWQDGEEVFESKVVVGRKSRKTPLLNTKLDSVIFNPTWNVPWKIMVEDILPKAKLDHEYLTNNNFEIIEAWRSSEFVSQDTIDWDNLKPSRFPYKLRQQAGNKNALGLYKFNTPNNRAIYLHDTPSKSLFDKDSRAFSSGCVRVEQAEEFASLLLETQVLKSADEANIALGEKTSVSLKKRIPVHIIYQTVLFGEDGIQYRNDIYQYDQI
ncbi:L,D-transpeptidase family protein [Vibrio makurazakiensis]|uniref:L,D-transpeptidase family protein n=1 Tax=Vibrio makurazakiensis TaxID=2910250 RepID=UPI003D0A8256